MTKSAGLGDNFYIAGYDLSGDVGAINSISGPRGLLNVTGIDKSATERIGGIRGGEIAWAGWFNASTVDQEHDALSSLPAGNRIAMYFRGTALGNPTACHQCKQINYDPQRAADGALALTIQTLAAAGFALDWGRSLTAGKRTDSAATNGTSVDHTAVSTAFGAMAYLNVFAFTGTSCTVTIEDSADNAAFALITGMTFTAATARTEERIATTTVTGTVRRYIRAVSAGTFSNCVFAVAFTRYEAAQG